MSSDEEDAYFRQRELERRADKRRTMAAAAKELQEKRRIAEGAGTDDTELVARIEKLGFTGETAVIFDLMPLVLVAWADGSVTRAERAAILEVLESRNVGRDSEAFLAIESLLEEKPSPAFIDESTAVIRDLLAGQGDAKAIETIDLCAAVADASGGFLGLGNRVSDEERGLLAKIADGLGSAAQEEFRKKL